MFKVAGNKVYNIVIHIDQVILPLLKLMTGACSAIMECSVLSVMAELIVEMLLMLSSIYTV